ncbi:hypothetical protein [Paenibacillus camerounensis]|uniref:hypothetical protein n=1 Tax=Paenibacillus camerounensis TaxID=1243663 RepID=UPI0005A6E3EF|nr:hypothetical protein [Paenibacillus camerounensis]
MNEITRSGSSFVGYDYKEVLIDPERTSMYVDGYANFGWVLEEKIQPASYTGKGPMGKVKLKLKRDRKILNKTELTRLERHFEACMRELERINYAKTSFAMMWALIIGIMGTAFMAGSVFAVTHDPPRILLCIVLAIPAFTGWIVPPVIYKTLVHKKAKKTDPLMEQKVDELYEICEKGNKLLI